MVINLINIILNKLLYIIMFIDLNKVFNFIIINKYLYLFFFITYVFMLFDNRFTSFIKFFFLPLFFLLSTILLTLIDLNNLWLWMGDLFWYTKLLNISFLLHTCWLHWIYIFFWHYRWEKVCWVVSRISFVFSLSFILFLLNYIHFFINHRIYLKLKVYIDGNVVLTYIYLYVIVLLQIIKTIVRFFMLVHGNYSILFMGVNKFKNFSFIDYLKNIIKFLIFIILTFILSYYILGICRLYLVWILLFVYEFLKLFYQYLKDYDDKYKNEGPYLCWNIFKKKKWLNKYLQFFCVYIILNYTKDVELKNKDYIKFIYKILYRTLFTYPQIEYLYMNKSENNFEYDSRYIPRFILFINYEPWIIMYKEALDWKLMEYDKTLDRNNNMIKNINDMAKIFNLTKLERISFMKYYTVDYEKRFRNAWREHGYTEKQIDKIWKGEYPF